MRRWTLLWLSLFIDFVHADPIDVRLGLLPAGSDVFSYEISVLKLALEHSGEETTLTLVPLKSMQTRAFRDLEYEEVDYNVFFSGFSAEREANFRQIDIPLTRGLLGQRVFATTEKHLAMFKEIKTLAELKKKVVVGSGIGWPDTLIFQHAGFEVTQSRYENLWLMLEKGRFNAFNRGINEVFVEIQQRSVKSPTLVVESYILIRYPLDYMFYLRKEDEHLATLIEKGLKEAYRKGAFVDHFLSHPVIKNVLETIKPSQRRVFELENPLMTDRQRNVPETYWHKF
ncbi:hypothetical protein [Litoribacillus peritrichatus]|uniref:Solute-binding protein family 3/N-terminal domain-containing protein n=1 Tax=Litoribacillus peritrichatus TaxID=718191 RepID=A0ABP7MH67_9GAMM